MPSLPRIDLKFRLTLQIVAVSVLCLAAASAYVLIDTNRSARARTEAIADLTAKALELQQGTWGGVNGQPFAFPDLSTIASSVMAPGVCVAFRASGDKVPQRVCGGTRHGDADPPKAFATLYRGLFDPGREAVRPIRMRGQALGEALASIDPATVTAEAWHEASRIVALMAATLLLLCGLAFAALSRALRPTRLVRAGLERIVANDLSARLPPFDLAELSAIRETFNHLAESLERSLAERGELTRRLIALQDDERRHLARELHDEFGQCLAGIRALAAAAGQTAAQDCPGLLPECESIARTAGQMMEALRGALFRLRSPDIEEFGLAASLEGLVAGWNGWSRGSPRFELALSGGFETVPAALGAGLYRIAQEAITNAAKHAGPSRVTVRLTQREATAEIELTVEDDGTAREPDHTAGPGMGLLGMRERVASLGGSLSFEAGDQAGSILRVVVSVAPSASCDGHTERAA